MDANVEPPPDFLATKTAASVGRCYPILMFKSILAWTKKFRTKLKKFRSSSYGGHDDHATTSIN
ncbi:MAG: hypothetical protein FWC50_01995, partial [Planctomycetaceae bacterium]|nr:hypothetical protein [Planctomycetaceae bacterium]